MAEDREALRRHYEVQRAQLLETIDGVSDELLTERSLDGWSIRDHLLHLGCETTCARARWRVSRRGTSPPGA